MGNWERNPASDALSSVPLAGSSVGITASGLKILHGSNISETGTIRQIRPAGNRCGHDKNSFKKPTFYGLRKPDARRPHTIEEALKRVDSAEKRLREFPTRSRFHLFENAEFASLFYGLSKNGKRRYRRSESIEAVIFLALRAIIFTTNLHKMACGFYDNRNEFHFYNYAYLEKISGQNESRLKRAMSVLKAEGVVVVTPMYKTLNDGKVITEYTKIEVSDKLFLMLGLYEEFLKDRETRSIKFHERQLRIDRKKTAQEIYRPKPLLNKTQRKQTRAVQGDIAALTGNLLRKPYQKLAYNPSCDRQVISLAYEYLKSGKCKDSKEATQLACKYLGKPPPH